MAYIGVMFFHMLMAVGPVALGIAAICFICAICNAISKDSDKK